MTDDLDDILGDGRKAEMESRFRELEQQEELERMRRGEPPRSRSSSGGASTSSNDDLADLKSKLGDDDDDAPAASAQPRAQADDAASADAERYVLILCPKCSAKNRTSLTKVRTRLPRCGACKASLSFTNL
jgi:hypothetical protein